MMLFLLSISVLILLVLSAICSSSEIAFFSLSKVRLRLFRTSQDEKKKSIAELLSDSKDLLITIFIVNTIVNILIQNISSDIFLDQGLVFKIGVPLILVLLFGELLPKYLGLIYNEQIALFFTKVIAHIHRFLSPIRTLVKKTTSFYSRLLFFFLKIDQPLSQQELERIVEKAEKKDILQKEEAILLRSFFRIEKKPIRDLMIPKSNMPLFNTSEPITKLIHLFMTQDTDEIPYCDESEEKILGMITAKDFFSARASINTTEDLLKIMKQPIFLPEGTSCKSVIAKMHARDIHSAIIVDEYGSTQGFVTLELLILRLVPFDIPNEEKNPEYKRLLKDTIIANGTMPLELLNELFGTDLESKYHQMTLGGWLSEQHGTIPQSGTKLETSTLLFRILSSDETKVRTVFIQSLKRDIQ